MKMLMVAPHGLGDAVMTVAAMNRYDFNSVELHVLVTNEYEAEAFRILLCKKPQKIYILKSDGILKIAFALLKESYDISFAQFGLSSIKYSLMVFLCRVRKRIGWEGSLSFLCTKVLMSNYNEHKIDQTSRMLALYFDCAKSIQTKMNWARIKLDEYIIIAPSSFENERKKRWPKDKFRKMVEILIESDKSLKIIGAGSLSEAVLINEIFSGLPNNRLINLAGKTSIKELADLVAGASCVVANCNAISHIADYIGTPVVAIYGPTAAEHTGIRNGVVVRAKDAPNCVPCYNTSNKFSCSINFCMTSVMVESIVDEVKYLINSARLGA
jgi:ADP-heptose:LPS heptosyltransferase